MNIVDGCIEKETWKSRRTQGDLETDFPDDIKMSNVFSALFFVIHFPVPDAYPRLECREFPETSHTQSSKQLTGVNFIKKKKATIYLSDMLNTFPILS